MGRWGKDLYDSDQALDAQATIVTDRIEREMAYWLSPEQVIAGGWWLAQVLAVIEAMLLFEQHEVHSAVYIQEQAMVQRWRTTFLSVWDRDWKEDDKYAYSDPEYRKQHRPAIIAMFDRLESIAQFWTAIGHSSEQPELTPLLADYPLPYFSIRHWTNHANEKVAYIERFTDSLIDNARKEIIYWLSLEKRSEVLAFDVEEVWVCVDILGFLCETYEQTPGVNEQFVRLWRDTTNEIETKFLASNGATWDDSDPLYQNVMRVFDRLEAVARKYPPIEW